VAHTLPFMYAPQEHAQHLCGRPVSMAHPAFLTVADMKSDVGASRGLFFRYYPESLDARHVAGAEARRRLRAK
jgi:hypothetical protein